MKYSVRYWEGRVRRNYTTRNGQRVYDQTLSVSIQHKGKRKVINLKTASKTQAAIRAKALYEQITSQGWESLDAKPLSDVTVGEFIRAVTAVAEVREKTLTNYVTSLRTIVAQIFRIDDAGKRRPGDSSWREQVDSVNLAHLTPEKIQKWKLSYSNQGDGPEDERRRRSNANSYLRNARSLFAVKVARLLPFEVLNPFAKIDFFARSSHRYTSTIDAPVLLAAAERELPEEQLKVFLLALLCGLRAAEIDKLTWELVDLERGTVTLKTTKYLKLKSETSRGTIPLDSGFLALLRGWKAKATGHFVVEVPVSTGKTQGYRSQRHFKRLHQWLRKRGVQDKKPLHALRKEFGSLLCEKHGIYVASRMLRHADVSITEQHYLSNPEGHRTTGLEVGSWSEDQTGGAVNE